MKGIVNVSSCRYLSQDVVKVYEKKKRIQIIVGLIVAGFCFFGIVIGLIENQKDYIMIYGPGIIAGIIVLLFGLKNKEIINCASRYENIFSCDSNGVITIDELSLQTGKGKDKILKELEKLFSQGFFTGCTFQRGGNPCVIISSAMVNEKGKGFVEVVCPKCKGVTHIRAGSRGKCQYCNSPISDTI